jgi:hypothetical protein
MQTGQNCNAFVDHSKNGSSHNCNVFTLKSHRKCVVTSKKDLHNVWTHGQAIPPAYISTNVVGNRPFKEADSLESWQEALACWTLIASIVLSVC